MKAKNVFSFIIMVILLISSTVNVYAYKTDVATYRPYNNEINDIILYGTKLYH